MNIHPPIQATLRRRPVQGLGSTPDLLYPRSAHQLRAILGTIDTLKELYREGVLGKPPQTGEQPLGGQAEGGLSQGSINRP